MGQNQGLDDLRDRQTLRRFMNYLLHDVEALEAMLRDGLFETDTRRIGAEQEFVMVRGAYRPAPIVMEVLEALNDSHFTTELARFNVELNLDPVLLGGDCLSQLHRSLNEYIHKLRQAVLGMDADVLLTGILPTLRLEDLDLGNMTPKPRYGQLNDALNSLRGHAYELSIKGTDELSIKHDSVMLEACNTSFQFHLQVAPSEFAHFYNVAQAISGPLLAVACNSPLLFGRRLWAETRIAVFQQAVDTRTSRFYLHDHSPRVHFGRRWVKSSVLELFQEDISRFPVLLGLNADEIDDPFQALAEGRPPKMRALQLHNGTIYRWNRPCYGVSNGKPHLRIENRILPAGPSTVDQISNAAFWLGLVHGMAEDYPDLTKRMTFDQARANFVAGARNGLGAQFTWIDGKMHPAKSLVLDHLLPLAARGLDKLGISTKDRERYLGTVQARTETERTGSWWLLQSLAKMKRRGTVSQQLCALTSSTIAHQKEGIPVHEWPLAELTAGGISFKQAYTRVEQIMTTDVVSVNEEELIDLVARVMDWHNIRYVPVVDGENHLTGLISHRSILRFLSRGSRDDLIAVKDIMHKLEDLLTVTPRTKTLDALEQMRRERIGCLPVLSKEGQLVGMLTERNFMTIAGQLLEQKLREADVESVRLGRSDLLEALRDGPPGPTLVSDSTDEQLPLHGRLAPKPDTVPGNGG